MKHRSQGHLTARIVALGCALACLLASFPVLAQLLRPPSIPATGAYLGAWVNPAGRAQVNPRGSIELIQLPLFQSEIGRPMAILHVFIPFNYADYNTTALLEVLGKIEATGAVPMVDLDCYDVDQINAGLQDATLANLATALARNGKPIFLRWYWEMNFSHPACESRYPPKYSGFVKAWRRLYAIFRRAPNVALVWCPLAADPDHLQVKYYPGDAYVDWIGADAFYRNNGGATAFEGKFGTWYGVYSLYPKPLLLGATGSVPFGQREWLLGQIQQLLPTSYPRIKAVLYFDAPGLQIVPGQTLVLAGDGLNAFKTLAQTPYFSYNDEAAEVPAAPRLDARLSATH